jgi:hypothetical protein
MRFARLERSPGNSTSLSYKLCCMVHMGPNLSSRGCADCFRIALHFFHLDMPVMVESLVVVRSVLLDVSQIHCLPAV